MQLMPTLLVWLRPLHLELIQGSSLPPLLSCTSSLHSLDLLHESLIAVTGLLEVLDGTEVAALGIHLESHERK